MFFLYLLHICLYLIYHLPYFFDLIEKIIHKAVSVALNVDGNIIWPDIVVVTLGLDAQGTHIFVKLNQMNAQSLLHRNEIAYVHEVDT